jgi:hypothetical protein
VSLYVAQAGLELIMFLLSSPNHRDYRCVPSTTVTIVFITGK